MKETRRADSRPPLGWVGFLLLAVVAARSLIFYREEPALGAVLSLLAAYGLLYVLEPGAVGRFKLFPLLYFPAQTAILLALGRQEPFLDVIQVLYLPLGLQAGRVFPNRQAAPWLALFAVCLNAALIAGIGWGEGLAFSLLVMAAGAFVLSYDRLLARMQSERDASERLVGELREAHEKLEEYAGQAEALAAMRERNQLARELHDSVSQSIFAIVLTSRAARLLLERAPSGGPNGVTAGVLEKLEHIRALTATALGQLRSLIAQLRPPPTG